MTIKEYEEKYNRVFGEIHVIRDYEHNNFYREFPDWNNNTITETKEWEIYLEHSCGSWVIGNVEKAEIMAKDLRKAVEFIKEQG